MAAVVRCDDALNGNPYSGACVAARANCVDPAHGGVPHSVCTMCAINTRMFSPVLLFALNNIMRMQHPGLPRNGGPGVQAPAPGYRVLLCGDCQTREVRIRNIRSAVIVPVEYDVPLADRTFMWNYPDNTCKCFQRIANIGAPMGVSNRHCWQHLLGVEAEIFNDMTTNQTWLETTNKSRAGVLGRAGMVLRRRRDGAWTYRACRCGKTIEAHYGGVMPAVLSDCWMCMACSGIIHQTPPVMPPIGRYSLRMRNRDVALQRRRVNAVVT